MCVVCVACVCCVSVCVNSALSRRSGSFGAERAPAIRPRSVSDTDVAEKVPVCVRVLVCGCGCVRMCSCVHMHGCARCALFLSLLLHHSFLSVSLHFSPFFLSPPHFLS